MSQKILVIDDEKFFLESLLSILKKEGFESYGALNAEEGIRILRENKPDICLLDIKLPDIDGITLLKYIKEIRDIPVIVISAYGTIDVAVEAIKRGAVDFIEKPFAWARVKMAIQNALKIKRMEKEIEVLKDFSFLNIPFIGESNKIKEVKKLIENVADKDVDVLICGETGTGKDIVARLIHLKSKRSFYPFQVIDCGTIPENLFEAEIFGYEKGAFTGADRRKVGKLYLADGGTIFFNEISLLTPFLQAKLLRFLETREFEPIGSNEKIKINVRIISSTNKDVDFLIKEGILREDFFYRISKIVINLPPLRERKEDIIPLAEYFLKNFCESKKIKIKRFKENALSALISYDYPGNIRELQNIVEKIVLLTESDEIDEKEVKKVIEKKERKTLKEAQQEFERKYIIDALLENEWKIEKTAKELGISRSQLFRKMKKFGIKK
jgi:DNA-binding NtrC family response regulator